MSLEVIKPSNKNNLDIKIKKLTESNISIITKSFEPFYAKPATIFEEYLKEQEAGERIIWFAFIDDIFAGYITLKWSSNYKPFADQNIPEIMDLNVLPPSRGQGIASKILEIAENTAARKSDIVGLGVGLYADYGSAQRLYIKRGYIPNGRGVTYNYESVKPGSHLCLDDDLVLWFTKKINA